MQSLYGRNRGTRVVPLTMDGRPVSGQEGQMGLFASAVWDEPSEAYIIKVVNTSDEPRKLAVSFNGLKKSEQLAGGRLTTFHSDDPDADNTLDAPDKITPKETAIEASGKTLEGEIGPMTFAIYKVGTARR